MPNTFAKEFRDIPSTLAANGELCEAILKLVQSEPMPGKATEGANRIDLFRPILESFFKGEIDLKIAISDTESKLPRSMSPYSDSNRVFATGWAERLVRTQISRFYNQAVLQYILASGHTTCRIHHSSDEAGTSNCSQLLAGTTQDASIMLERLIENYRDGVWGKEVKIPDHPHCTHTIFPSTE